MDGWEWVSGNVGNGWASEMRDDIAWQECVRYGINIFLDALKFYNIWPWQEKSAVIWLKTLREPTQTHQDRRMAQEMDASRMMFIQIYWHKLKHAAGKWCEVTRVQLKPWHQCSSSQSSDCLPTLRIFSLPASFSQHCSFLHPFVLCVAHWWKSCWECWCHLSAVDRLLAPASNSYYKYNQGICDEYTRVFRALIGWRGCDSQRRQRLCYFRGAIFYK